MTQQTRCYLFLSLKLKTRRIIGLYNRQPLPIVPFRSRRPAAQSHSAPALCPLPASPASPVPAGNHSYTVFSDAPTSPQIFLKIFLIADPDRSSRLLKAHPPSPPEKGRCG